MNDNKKSAKCVAMETSEGVSAVLPLQTHIGGLSAVWVVSGTDFSGQPPCRSNMFHRGSLYVQQKDIHKVLHVAIQVHHIQYLLHVEGKWLSRL